MSEMFNRNAIGVRGRRLTHSPTPMETAEELFEGLW